MRLPGKPLARIAGVPMIVRVAAQVSRANVDRVVVAVDDERVRDVVLQAGYECVMTRVDHASGSDRVMEVAEQLNWSGDDVIINVQGDEPLIPPQVIMQIVEAFAEQPDLEMATLSEPLATAADFLNPNIVKVVTDEHGTALYFSRAPIPFPRDAMAATGGSSLEDGVVQNNRVQRHIGVYGFRTAALRTFVGIKDSRLERIESLEQLRWLEAGRKLSVLESVTAVPGGIDTPEDLARVEAVLAEQ